MIDTQTKEKIIETARIEEVVGDFVALKKRGANLLGLCPFHNERTPSFTVSPAKGFYKCFGCGKAGDSVTFMMEHDQLSFPDALRYLANKYNITIEEQEPSPQFAEEKNQRESLFIVSAFAQRYYTEQLWETEAGKAIGLSYFRERGFTDEIINKFQLGFSPDGWNAFTIAAMAAGYQMEFLEKAGLTINAEGKQFDRFRGRVMFPIHNLTGKVIGFGARILKADNKTAKYLNSPETDIYHKSSILYGISQARKMIVQNDECFLVEGYTDVLSLHQSGIENVVASSGTSLTVEQIRLIARYSRNITVLYDGDAAGIKASLRGIDLILEEGLNVRVLLFPDGEDPDSFAKKVSALELKEYVKSNAVDFISFKTKLLLADAANDPIKKAGLIKDIVESIAKVPDVIQRATYIRQTSTLMEMDEQILLQEMNRLLRKTVSKVAGPADDLIAELLPDPKIEAENSELNTVLQEQEIIRILLNYADRPFALPLPEGSEEDNIEVMPVLSFIVNELLTDGIRFSNPQYAALFAEFSTLNEQSNEYNQQQFLQKLETTIRSAAIGLLTPSHQLSSWESHGIVVKTESAYFQKAIIDPVMYLKKKQLLKMKKDNQEMIREREAGGLGIDDLMEKEKIFISIQQEINKFTNTVIQK
jgi:DNA primase